MYDSHLAHCFVCPAELCCPTCWPLCSTISRAPNGTPVDLRNALALTGPVKLVQDYDAQVAQCLKWPSASNVRRESLARAAFRRPRIPAGLRLETLSIVGLLWQDGRRMVQGDQKRINPSWYEDCQIHTSLLRML